MNEKLSLLNQLLDEYERELENAYIDYAKKIDMVSSQEMKVINSYVDKIIQLKTQITEEEAIKHYD